MSDRIQIVDENDNLKGHKARREVDYNKDIYRSSALWVVNSKAEVLIAQRKLTKDKDPGKWGPSVAGTVDEGEDYDINVYKEAEEEIGLTGYTFKKLGLERLFAPRHQFVQWYGVVVDKPLEYFVPQEEEVEQLRWIAADELIEKVDSDPDKYVASMDKALEFLRKFV
jgi:isopentenyldiphosphate isomerase